MVARSYHREPDPSAEKEHAPAVEALEQSAPPQEKAASDFTYSTGPEARLAEDDDSRGSLGPSPASERNRSPRSGLDRNRAARSRADTARDQSARPGFLL